MQCTISLLTFFLLYGQDTQKIFRLSNVKTTVVSMATYILSENLQGMIPEV